VLLLEEVVRYKSSKEKGSKEQRREESRNVLIELQPFSDKSVKLKIRSFESPYWDGQGTEGLSIQAAFTFTASFFHKTELVSGKRDEETKRRREEETKRRRDEERKKGRDEERKRAMAK
jgi:hypothetical protein